MSVIATTIFAEVENDHMPIHTIPIVVQVGVPKNPGHVLAGSIKWSNRLSGRVFEQLEPR